MTDQPTNDSEEPKNPVGRPLKFKSPEDLDRAIRRYFKSCEERWVFKRDWVIKANRKGKTVYDKDGQPQWVRGKVRVHIPATPPGMAGLAAALGTCRQTLLNYKERPEFLDSIAAAKAKCEAFNEAATYGSASRGAIFNAINNYDGYVDKQVKDLQSKGEPIKAMVEFVGEDEADDADNQD